MKRKRWTGKLVGGLLGLAALGGCKQQLFLEPADYQEALKAGPQAKLEELERLPHEAIVPATAVAPGSSPGTVLDPARTPRNVTLKELIAIALEQGNVGSQIITNPGILSDQLPQYTGRGTSGTDTIRAFMFDPAVAGAEVERALSKFDARWVTSMTWNKTDAPTLTLQQSFSNGDSATLTSTLAKPLPTGGVAGITFSTQYLNLSNPPAANTGFVTLPTSYTPQIQFTFEQPLLQGFGVEINQLLPNHPGSQLLNIQASGGAGSEGILITRVRTEQQRAQFDTYVNFMLLNVETAYWNLYSAYYNLAAQEEGLKQSLEGYLYFANRANAGAARVQEALQARAQYDLFRSQVVQARSDLLSRERNLRGVLGMRSDDGTRLIPVDEPTLVPFIPDYVAEATEAIASRPELMIARNEVKAQQLNILAQKNLRRPDLRFLSSYSVAGLGPRLDGSGFANGSTGPIDENAFKALAANRFQSWQLGFRLNMPIGFRDANALVREAQLTMRKTYFQLLDAERKTIEEVADQVRTVVTNQELIRHRRAQRAYLEKSLELDRQIRELGAAGANADAAAAFISNLLQKQRDLATATASEFQAIANYNNALCALEAAKGTIQRYNNVSVAEGPLPAHVGKKAADHFREREAALKLREQPDAGGAALPAQYQPLSEDALNGYNAKVTEGDVNLWKNGVANPATVRPWQPSGPNAPAPVPMTQPEPAPLPAALPARPMTPPSQPLPAPATLPGNGGAGLRPQLQAADGQGTFAPVDTVRLPRPYRGPAVADAPAPASPSPIPTPLPPTAGAPQPLPVTTGTGGPVGILPPSR